MRIRRLNLSAKGAADSNCEYLLRIANTELYAKETSPGIDPLLRLLCT